MNKLHSQQVLDALELQLNEIKIESDNDLLFLKRVYNQGNLEKYRTRINSIGFTNKDSPILDAGCGYGQWTLVLSETNKNVIGIDVDNGRLDIATNIVNRLSVNNIKFINSSLNCKGFSNESFGSIFCFNSIMLSPWRETLKNFYRVLKSGGYLYFNAYDIGWMIENIVNPSSRNSAKDFDPRAWAISTIENTNNYLATNNFIPTNTKESLFIPSLLIKDDLEQIGYELISLTGDGRTLFNPSSNELPFGPDELHGRTAMYEVLAKKL